MSRHDVELKKIFGQKYTDVLDEFWKEHEENILKKFEDVVVPWK